MKIESINGFRIGDKVRLKDGDGRPHIIKSFEIDGWHGFFVVAHFEDAASTMIDNLSLLEPQGLDEAAEEYAFEKEEPLADGERLSCKFNSNIDAFKAGAKWQKSQEFTHIEPFDNEKQAAVHYMEDCQEVDDFVRRKIDYIAERYFCAGAKWMAEQGVSFESAIDYYDGYYLDCEEQEHEAIEKLGVKVLDKVIVQIRKAE